MKRGDKYVYLLCALMVWWVSGCVDKAQTSSGGGSAPPVTHELSGKLLAAFNLVKDRYDFSTVNIRYGDAQGNWMLYFYDTQTIVASERVVNSQSDIRNSCTLAHELAHHNGGDQEAAHLAGERCLATI